MHQQETIPASSPEAAEPAEIRYQCRHVFTDGHRCGSPCLRGQDFCYFHHTSRRPIQDPAKRRRRQSRFDLPAPCDLADRSGIQLSIAQVLGKLANNDLDPRRAGLLLYGLQIASLNLPKREAKKPLPEEPVDQIEQDPRLGALAPVEEYVSPAEDRQFLKELVADTMKRMVEESRLMSEQERNRFLLLDHEENEDDGTETGFEEAAHPEGSPPDFDFSGGTLGPEVSPLR